MRSLMAYLDIGLYKSNYKDVIVQQLDEIEESHQED